MSGCSILVSTRLSTGIIIANHPLIVMGLLIIRVSSPFFLMLDRSSS